MKKHEISKGFADVMKDALSEGFFPEMMELTGSYSNIEGHQVVLANGNERIVMWMERIGRYWDSSNPERIVLKAARFAVECEDDIEWKFKWSDSWDKHVYFESAVWRVDDDWYVDSESEAVAACETRHVRYRRKAGYKDYDRFVGNGKWELTDELLAIVRKVKGFKTVKRDNIEVVKSGTTWRIINAASGNEVRLSA